MPAIAWSSCAAQPEIACPRVKGVASCKCVRPTITIWEKAFALASSVSRNCVTAGSSAALIRSTVAMCMTVGNTSFDDWL